VYGPELVRKVKTPHASWEIPPLTGNLYPLGEVSPRKAPLKTFATGLWGVQGDEHREHRKLLLPAFHRDRISGYRDDIVAVTSRTFEAWRPGDDRDLHHEMLGLTAKVATTTLLGGDDDAGGDEQRPEQTAERIWELVASPLTQLAPYDLPGLPYRRFVDGVTTFDTQMRKVIRHKRSSGATDHADVLSSLITSTDEEGGAALTEDELVGHVGSIFGAAHETTASALTWTVFLLAQHPTVYADLVDEVEGRLKGDPPSVDELSDMPLLDRVVKESLRIIPPVPVTWRIAADQVELGGYAIPHGAEVYASTYHTHHMPELYPDAEMFEPRRWENFDPSTYEYVPFGAGPRRCIGDMFATVEMKIVLSMLLQQFRVQFPARMRVDRVGFPVIRPKRGLPVMVRSQDRRFDTPVSAITGNVREMATLP
jgi:cytochrome P450